MNKSPLIKCALVFLIFIVLISCNKDLDYSARHGLEVSKQKCRSCHAPSQKVVGPSFEKIHQGFGSKKNLRKYLKAEFKGKRLLYSKHNDINLTNKEINSICIYLDVLSGKYSY